MFGDFKKFAFNMIWKEMEKSLKDIFIKVIKEKVLLFDDNSKHKLICY